MPKKIKCIICGHEYDYCNCKAEIAMWGHICDTLEHYQTYVIIREYTNQIIKKEDAKNKLKQLGIDKEYKTFLPNVVQILDEILEEDTNTTSKTKSSKTKE